MAAFHGTIDCVENLQKQYPEHFSEDKLDQMESIVTQHSKAPYVSMAVGPQTPTSLSHRPGAQMSIEYAAAAQLVDGVDWMAQFSADRLNRLFVRKNHGQSQADA